MFGVGSFSAFFAFPTRHFLFTSRVENGWDYLALYTTTWLVCEKENFSQPVWQALGQIARVGIYGSNAGAVGEAG